MKTITKIIADGLDASVDGRGFGAEHLKAVTLANAAPDLLDSLKMLLRMAEKQLDQSPTDDGLSNCDALAIARAAIAKAEP